MVTYSMQVWDKHLTVTGPFPVCDLKFITMLAAQHGFNVIDLFLARHYGVSLYVTTREFADATTDAIHSTQPLNPRYEKMAALQGEEL